MSGIYIHIPFCKQACSYCDFYFITQTGYRNEFVDSLISEIKSYSNTQYVQELVKSVYFGGGTPSLLKPSDLERVMGALHEVFRLDTEEITLEMNPDDVNKDYLKELLNLGITRSSMGVQSFKPELLEFMNRAHTREHALKCLELLQSTGFRTFTVDLIYGNPGQDLQDLEEDLETLIDFDPPHVSAYSLTVEPKTKLGKQVELGRIDPPGDEVVSDHYDMVVEKLADAGIQQYEVSNYSKPGHEAIHNSSYWRHENYLGLGPAAHSFWWDNEEARRWSNRSDLKAYLEEGKPATLDEKETLTLLQLAEERLMLGLRTREGVPRKELNERYNYRLNSRQLEYIHQKEKENKFIIDSETLRLTAQGRKIADSILLDIVTMH
ncbi:radical SAM family heme chaperone HemW [Aliifodinibius sp. S!AR15-10]|uniref:radical SAM family heme chaperone HemW n=1 Tax=Aliifodinibius sp. S!AR15-10 TaxID=2950437 RepID=UPI00285577EE|nr:radical SAM family heme chaperone HemW [Aliifodinibius sp. S!AR15-10]MDR8393685.1 radical SAM family heme chaperone HemW [Aliifodinibius sp. S!AR15-10]